MHQHSVLCSSNAAFSPERFVQERFNLPLNVDVMLHTEILTGRHQPKAARTAHSTHVLMPSSHAPFLPKRFDFYLFRSIEMKTKELKIFPRTRHITL